MIYSTEHIGHIIRKVRKKLGVTQSDLALSAGTGLRFIIELEKGKSTCLKFIYPHQKILKFAFFCYNILIFTIFVYYIL